MSRIQSKVTTIKCDRFECEKERIVIGEETKSEGWTTVEKWDLCPEHKDEFMEFMLGPRNKEEVWVSDHPYLGKQ